MSSDPARDTVAELPVHLELHASLGALTEPGSSLYQALSGVLEERLSGLMSTLGIPGLPTVRLGVIDDNGAPDAARAMRLSVDGRIVRYPPELLRSIYVYLNGRMAGPEMTPAATLAWLQQLSGQALDADGDNRRSLLECLSLACLEVVKGQPGILLGASQAAAYFASLPDGHDRADASRLPLDPRALGDILRGVLDLGISIANREAVADLLRKGSAAGRTPEDLVEDLVDALRSNVVEIQMLSDDLRALTIGWEAEGPAMFPFLREGLFAELGLVCPGFRFTPATRLRPQSFRFKINDLTTLPVLTLRKDQCLVNDIAERLQAFGIAATPSINPATGQPGSVIDAGAETMAGERGLTSWNEIQFLVLCMAECLRENGYRLLHRRGVQDSIRPLEVVFPALVRMARASIPDEAITRVLRGLMRERVSIRNLRAVLERLVDCHSFAELRTAEPLAVVRAGLNAGVKSLRGSNVLVVYLMDPRIERLAGEGAGALDANAEAILGALRTELAHLPLTVAPPSLLTTGESRAPLRELIRTEFPRISVIAQEELPSWVNVMPVARITLPDDGSQATRLAS